MKKFLLMFFLLAFAKIVNAAGPITEEEILDVQNEWAQGIVNIGQSYKNGNDYEKVAVEVIDNLYGYDYGNVLFKPTKAHDRQFRDSKKSALSYFVGGKVSEDKGFALTPWSKVEFDKDRHISIVDDVAIVMGNYYFTDSNTGEDVKVEYTFGYRRAPDDDRLVIFTHHSSLPYNPN